MKYTELIDDPLALTSREDASTLPPVQLKPEDRLSTLELQYKAWKRSFGTCIRSNHLPRHLQTSPLYECKKNSYELEKISLFSRGFIAEKFLKFS